MKGFLIQLLLIYEAICQKLPTIYVPNDKEVLLSASEQNFYLNLSPFKINSIIYILFNITDGEMNKEFIIQEKNYEPQMEYQDYYYISGTIYYAKRIMDDEAPQYYILEYTKKSYSYYLLIHYRELTSNSYVSISSEDPLKNYPLEIKNQSTYLNASNSSGYLFLNYDNFDNYDSFYIYFNITSEKNIPNISLYYKHFDLHPRLYLKQFNDLNSKSYDKVGTLDSFNLYSYKFDKPSDFEQCKYLLLFIENINDYKGYQFSVQISKKDPFIEPPKYLSKDKALNLFTYISPNYIYYDCSELETDTDDIYISFEDSLENLTLYYNYMNNEPIETEYNESMFKTMNNYSANYQTNSSGIIKNKYVYKFSANIKNDKYLLIKYYPILGKAINISYSKDEPILSTPIYFSSNDELSIKTNENNGYFYISNKYFSSSNYLLITSPSGSIEPLLHYENINLKSGEIPTSSYSFNNKLNAYQTDDKKSPRYYGFTFPIEKYYSHCIFRFTGLLGNELKIQSYRFDPFADLPKYIPKSTKISVSYKDTGSLLLNFSDYNNSSNIYLYLIESRVNNRYDPQLTYNGLDEIPKLFAQPDSYSYYTASPIDYYYYSYKEVYMYNISRQNLENYLSFDFEQFRNKKFYTFDENLFLNLPQQLSKSNLINIKSNFGYLFLNLSDFRSENVINVYFNVSFGSMNQIISYMYTNGDPLDFEQFGSFVLLDNKNYSDTIQDKNGSSINHYEFLKYSYYSYIVIKYENISEESSILVSNFNPMDSGSSGPSGNSGLSALSIAFIVIGVIVVIILGIVAYILINRKRKSKNLIEDTPTINMNMI